ncbi:MAG TPA: hypothetical protein VFO36_13355 [Nitrospiraceae bacterium]|nr:hypothetical protein [Nitrospiraceae bacterium]
MPLAQGNRALLPQPSLPVRLDVGRLLGLDEPKASRVRGLLSEEQARVRQMIASERRTFVNPAELSPIRSATDEQVAQLLNKQEHEHYMDLRQNELAYERIDRLHQELATRGAGLTQLQRDTLLAAMKDEWGAVIEPKAAEFGTQMEFQNAMHAWRERYEQRIQERTAIILTPAQIEQLNGRGARQPR